MVTRRLAWILAIAAFIVVLLNFTRVSYLPLLSEDHAQDSDDPASSHLDPKLQKHSNTSQLKPWPSPSSSYLPSFLPWFPPQAAVPPRSCEGFFGNGFLRTINLLDSSESTKFSPISHNKKANNKKDDDDDGHDMVWNIHRNWHNDDDDDDVVRNTHGDVSGNINQVQHGSNDDMPDPVLRCYFSETLRTSICEGRNIVMHPGRMSMSKGGEAIGSVLGRTDDQELPDFSAGAFELIVPPSTHSSHGTGSSDSSRVNGISDFAISAKLVDAVLPKGQIHDHRLRLLFSKIRAVRARTIKCSKVKEPTLLIIRYEYANLFHTATDWYSSYVASRVIDLKNVPNVVFIDGHCESPMDDGWEALFSSVKYAKHFDMPICFDHVVFTPLGYETALFKGLNSGIPCKGCPAKDLKEKKETTGETARLREFGEFFKYSFGISNPKTDNVIKILFVRRENYLAHPRHGGKPEVRLQNEQEDFNEMTKWAEIRSKEHAANLQKRMDIKIINGTLAHMRMKDQVQAVHDASIIVGAHGAGLTHILFAQPGTVILELLSPLFMRPHYAHISQWMGLEYHSIIMPATVADSAKVIENLSNILDKLM